MCGNIVFAGKFQLTHHLLLEQNTSAKKTQKLWQNTRKSVDCVCCRSCYSIQTVGSQSGADCDSSCPIRWQNIMWDGY